MTKKRRWIPFAGALAALAFTASASAHAVVSPPVAKSKTLQQFTLSVPTEKENAITTAIELTVPDGFAIDSFEPPATPWKQEVQAKGSGGGGGPEGDLDGRQGPDRVRDHGSQDLSRGAGVRFGREIRNPERRLG